MREARYSTDGISTSVRIRIGLPIVELVSATKLILQLPNTSYYYYYYYYVVCRYTVGCALSADTDTVIVYRSFLTLSDATFSSLSPSFLPFFLVTASDNKRVKDGSKSKYWLCITYFVGISLDSYCDCYNPKSALSLDNAITILTTTASLAFSNPQNLLSQYCVIIVTAILAHPIIAFVGSLVSFFDALTGLGTYPQIPNQSEGCFRQSPFATVLATLFSLYNNISVSGIDIQRMKPAAKKKKKKVRRILSPG